MKTRKLRPVVEKTLIVIAIILFICIGSLQDFNALGALITFGALITLALILRILRKYGRGIAFIEK